VKIWEFTGNQESGSCQRGIFNKGARTSGKKKETQQKRRTVVKETWHMKKPGGSDSINKTAENSRGKVNRANDKQPAF